MFNAATYSATDRLRDGRTFEVRALKPSDEADMLAAVGRIGAQSLYRRFMGAKRGFSDKERAFFLNVDFVNHVALVAVVKEGDRATIVAGGRYIVEKPERPKSPSPLSMTTRDRVSVRSYCATSPRLPARPG